MFTTIIERLTTLAGLQFTEAGWIYDLPINILFLQGIFSGITTNHNDTMLAGDERPCDC